MMIDKEACSKNIKNLRYQMMLTQDQFGKLLGISRLSIYSYECGLRVPSMRTAKMIVAVLSKHGVNISSNLLRPIQ